MKLLPLIIALSPVGAFVQAKGYVNFIRQNQQNSGVVWDMQVAPRGKAPSALALENQGSLFQLWTIEPTQMKEYLLDQKLVGAYLPKADIKITTLDPYTLVPRTRVDQPFSVEIEVADLLTGTGLPDAATKVLLEQHVQSSPEELVSLDPSTVAATTPNRSAYISENGKTVLKFPASSLTAKDPTKARGEEHFIVHALSDGRISQTQIASAHVQVWPIASGAILGITPGQEIRFSSPKLYLQLNDLYPRSDTYLKVYEGSQINGVEGTLVKAFPMDRDRSASITLEVTELTTAITEDGSYTMALMSETVYGTELLCDPIPFTVRTDITVNAMQTDYSDGVAP